MIDIKDIKLMDYSYKGNMLITINLKPSEFKHLKQQLQQDQEEAKKYRYLLQQILEEKI